jgi:beta-lactam-binding protein with PASTA domain
VRRILLAGACALAFALALPVGASPGPKRCLVPKVVGKRLVSARVFVQAGGCRVGRIVRVGSVVVPRRRVLAQRPAAGRRLPLNARVHLVVSSGTPKH